MKQYASKDIKIIRWDEHVRSHPKMYFGDKKITGEEIGEAFSEAAKLLGAKKTQVFKIKDWFYFCSDIDWVFNSKFTIENIEMVFNHPCIFPEAGVNGYRYESLCAPFSSAVYTIASGKIVVIKGELPNNELISQEVSKFGQWGRIVGYKFNYN